MSAHAALAEPRWAPAPRAATLRRALRPGPGVWLGGAGGAALAGIAFGASGGLGLHQTTTVEIILTLACALAIAAAVVAAPAALWAYGGPSIALFGALGILTALSVAWSFDPASSWLEGSRTAAYVFVFAAAVAGARVLPQRWASVLGAVISGGFVVCVYALLTKVFPSVDVTENLARLRAPYGYWNAIGLTAAIATLPCLWLGARRSGHAALNALAFPALGIFLVTIMLAYSRGALLALAVGCAFWFAFVPLRLRGAAVLATAAVGATGPVIWTFSRDVLTKDKVDIGLRATAGHQLGILLAVMVVLLTAAGLVVGFLTDRRPLAPATRRTVGTAILVALALVPVGLGTALAASSRGLGGSLSHDWNALTNPHARTPPNDPSRLTAVGSVRARYWNEALKIFQDHRYIGAGAGAYGIARLRYRQDTLDVQHAHGYVVQTLADLGLLGMGISLALLVAWLLAAARSAAPGGWRPPRLTDGLAALAARAGPRRGSGPGPSEGDPSATTEMEPVGEPVGSPARPPIAGGAEPLTPPDAPSATTSRPSSAPASYAAATYAPATSAPATAAPATPAPPPPIAAGPPSGIPLAVGPGPGGEAGAEQRERAVLPYTPERIGLLTLTACVVAFGVHSAIDWTWFVPGNACVALLCAGWVAGRGPFEASTRPAAPRQPGPGSWAAASPPPRSPARRWPSPAELAARLRPVASRAAASARLHARLLDPGRGAVAVVVLLVAAAVAWSQWQPLRSANTADDALAALGNHDFARARALALTADRQDPVSVDPLFDLAVIDTVAGNKAGAHHALDQAVRRQPANPGTWMRLAEFDLTALDDPNAALKNLRPALFLDPRSYQVQGAVLDVVRRLASGPPTPRPAARQTRAVPPTLLHPGAGKSGTSSAATP